MRAFSRVLLVLMVVFSVVHAIDFVAYGQKLQNALASVGFGLMAYGTCRDPAYRGCVGPSSYLRLTGGFGGISPRGRQAPRGCRPTAAGRAVGVPRRSPLPAATQSAA